MSNLHGAVAIADIMLQMQQVFSVETLTGFVPFPFKRSTADSCCQKSQLRVVDCLSEEQLEISRFCIYGKIVLQLDDNTQSI
jgi:hypothetical protein